MKIGLYGYTDKRPVLYTLITALQASGEVAVITPNRHLTRLIGGNTDLGYYGNTLICVTDWTPDEVWRNIDHEPDDFAHIIYDLTNSVADTDANILVLGSEYEDGEEDFVEMLDELTKIKLMYDGRPGGANFLNVPISADYLGVVEKIERNKVYSSFNNKQLNAVIAKVLSKHLKMTEASIVKYLQLRQRKG